jgi:hypothetical protein
MNGRFSTIANAKLIVMAGLDPAIPLRNAPRFPKRDARHKAGHDKSLIMSVQF